MRIEQRDRFQESGSSLCSFCEPLEQDRLLWQLTQFLMVCPTQHAPNPRANAGTVMVGSPHASQSSSFLAQAAEDNKEQFFGIIRLA